MQAIKNIDEMTTSTMMIISVRKQNNYYVREQKQQRGLCKQAITIMNIEYVSK